MSSSVIIDGIRVELMHRLELCLRIRRMMTEAALGAAKAAIEAVLQDEANERLGRERYEWRYLSRSGTTDWRCKGCGTNAGEDFGRNGVYRRNLALRQGLISNLRVPRVRCQVCGSSIPAIFAVIEKYKRFWYDLTELALMEYGLSLSLRRIAAKLGKALGGISLSTLTSRIHSIEAGIWAWKNRPIEDVPDVVQLDGIWFSRMVPTGKRKRDKRGRLRMMKRRVARVVLVAVGIWTKSGKREILDWHVASSESEDAWLHLLDRLYDRGLTGERGLRLIVHDGNGGVTSALCYGYFDVLEQRCIFHKIRNVADGFRKDGGGSVEEITKDTSHVFKGKSKWAVKQRLWHFRKKWESRQPKSVRSLMSDFEKTLSYFDAGIDAVRFLRTTSQQERANRELRRKFDQMGVVQSEKGEQSAVHLAVLAYNYYAGDDDWTDIITDLYSSSLASLHTQ